MSYCPGCANRDALIAELEARLAEAEAGTVVLQKRLSALVANPVIAGMSARIRDDARQRGRTDPYAAAEDALMNGVTGEVQALTRLVEAVGVLVAECSTAAVRDLVGDSDFVEALCGVEDTYADLQAARTGRGEGK